MQDLWQNTLQVDIYPQNTRLHVIITWEYKAWRSLSGLAVGFNSFLGDFFGIDH